ncbi:hypothetical protein [Enterobacter chuandaensis]|uniref:hypothetical protein n=1 Tax=Enterobacter chuandaensis TaxID=2497875 RepID=UPI000E76DA95|nr:hypothetical protein [Enterobacter chuandaensis]RJL02257.1 hypothetical protein D5066_11175 [Enterobacter chuandaensis]
MKKSTLLTLPLIVITALLAGCNTDAQTSAPTDRTPLKTQTVPLPYHVTLSGSGDDRMQCENCGNSGKKLFINGGEKLSQYNMMVDSPYFVFLCSNSADDCRKGKWIAVNKNLAEPQVRAISLAGKADVSDLRPANDASKTWLNVTYANGDQHVFEFDNNK